MKLIGFGESALVGAGQKFYKPDSSAVEFTAPEVYEGGQCCKSDIWSVGVLLCIVLTGYAPYLGMNESETRKEVLKGGLPFNLQDWKNVSDLARDFVLKCLSSKP